MNPDTGRSPNRLPLERTRRQTPRKQSSRTPYQIVGIILLCAVSICSGYFGYLYGHSRTLRKLVAGNGLTVPSVASAFPGAHQMNLMIIGRDYDYDNNDQIIHSHARSDMLMVARFDLDTGDVRMLSIPRDTEALVPGHGYTKINAAHAFGGPDLAAATIQENFGIPIDHYVALDFIGFQKAIDLLGGVDLTVYKQMDYDDNWGHLHIHLLPGFQHLDGEKAMEFVRFRHSDSDLIRTQRQQELLAQLKTKLMQPQTLTQLPQLIDVLGDSVQTDLSTPQEMALASYLHSVPQDKIAMQTLPSIEGGYYVRPDWTQAAGLLESWFGVTSSPLRYELRHHHRFSHRRYT